MAGKYGQNTCSTIDWWARDKKGNPGSPMGKMYVRGDKRFCCYKVEKDTLTAILSDTPVDGAYCVTTNRTNKRSPIPSVVMDMYHNIVDTHSASREENKSVLKIKTKTNARFSLPSGTSYTADAPTVSMNDYQELNRFHLQETEYHIYKALMDFSAVYCTMTIYLNDDKSYIHIEPIYGDTGHGYPTFDEMEKIAGLECRFFPYGKMTISFEPDTVRVPKCFYTFNEVRGRKDKKIVMYSDGQSLLITPEEDICIINGDIINSAEGKSKKTVLCKSCSDVIIDNKEVISTIESAELLDEVKNLIADFF